MVSHICGFGLAGNESYPISFSRLMQYLQQPLGELIVALWQRHTVRNYWRLHAGPTCSPDIVAIVNAVVLNHSEH